MYELKADNRLIRTEWNIETAIAKARTLALKHDVVTIESDFKEVWSRRKSDKLEVCR